MMPLVLELDDGGPCKMDRNEPMVIFDEMYVPLKTRYLMFNSKYDYKVVEKVQPGYLYYLAIPGYMSTYDVGKIIYKSCGWDAIPNLVEHMNNAEGHTGLKWKGRSKFEEKYREPPWYVYRDPYDDRVNIY